MGARWDAFKTWALSTGGAVGKSIKGSAIFGGKLMLAGAALAGGAYAAASLVGAMRGRREYVEPPKPDPLSMQDPYADLMPAVMQQEQTLMGQTPVEGKFAQQVLARRGGMAQGINTAAPDIEQDGRSTIDGRPVQNLGGIGM